MNKKAIYWTGGAAALIIIVLLSFTALGRNKGTKSDDPAPEKKLSGYLDEENELMRKMMDDMDRVEPTGNAALDFLAGMIPHHQAAVSMSESYLKYGSPDAELLELAEDIIQTQEQEIQQMQSLSEEIKKSGKQNSEQEQAYLENYRQMMSAHHSSHNSHSASDNVEAAFAKGMIMHHQMAVDMAQAIVGNTDEEQVNSLAQNIIETQQAEIKQMQDILKRTSKNTDSHH